MTIAQATIGFDTTRLMHELSVLQFLADLWPVWLVVLTALGVYGFAHAEIAWYRWERDEARDQVRTFLAENARLRKLVSAYEGSRDE